MSNDSTSAPDEDTLDDEVPSSYPPEQLKQGSCRGCPFDAIILLVIGIESGHFCCF